MKTNEIFRLSRILGGKKQKEVAAGVGIKQPSVQRYEAGLTKLSKNTLLRIAPLLDINPEYVTDQTKNPFQSEGLIKMFFSEDMVSYGILEPINTLLAFNDNLTFLSLISKFDLPFKGTNFNFSLNPTYAIAIKDEDNNVFLLRRKLKTDYVLADGNLYDKMSFTLRFVKERRRSLYFAALEIDKNLHEKVMSWTVEREDIEPLFSECKFMSYFDPTQQELAQLRKQRDMNIEPLTALELTIIKEVRVEEIGSDQALKSIQSGKNNKQKI